MSLWFQQVWPWSDFNRLRKTDWDAWDRRYRWRIEAEENAEIEKGKFERSALGSSILSIKLLLLAIVYIQATSLWIEHGSDIKAGWNGTVATYQSWFSGSKTP